MWNVLRHQIKNYVQNLKNQKEGDGNVLMIKKVPVQLTVQQGLTAPPTVIWGYIVLNDVTPRGMYVFSTEPFKQDQSVAVTLEEPKRFYAKTKVISCQNVKTDSRVISEKTYAFRLALEYEAETEEEKAALKAFAEDIQQNYLYRQKAA